MNDPKKLKDSLEIIFKNLGAPPVDVITNLKDYWVEIVGPTIANHCYPIAIEENVLVIKSDNAAWTSQLLWMESQIIESYKNVFELNDLDKIRVEGI